MQQAMHQPQQPPRCNHDQTAVRWRRQSNGVEVCGYQCLTCGTWVRAISKQSAEAVQAERVPFDEALRERWDAHIRAFYDQRREQQEQDRDVLRDAERRIWRANYNEYLKSEAWQVRRRAVLKRAGYVCEGCGVNTAQQVHHLTYKHVGNELLFQLVAVCNDCHAHIHDGGAAW